MPRLVLLVSAGVLAGCAAATSAGSARPDPVLTVKQALALPEGAGPVAVSGYLLAAEGQDVRLCTGLAGSYPPQCGRPALTVRGLDLARLDQADREQGVTWTGRITLRGNVARGVLTVQPPGAGR